MEDEAWSGKSYLCSISKSESSLLECKSASAFRFDGVIIDEIRTERFTVLCNLGSRDDEEVEDGGCLRFCLDPEVDCLRDGGAVDSVINDG